MAKSESTGHRPKAKIKEDEWVETTEEAKPKKTADEGGIDTRIIIGVAIAFFALAAFFVIQNRAASESFNKAAAYGIDVYSKGTDPLADLRVLGGARRFVAAYLNEKPTIDERNVLVHIGTVSNSQLYEGGPGYKIIVGITNRTGIWISKTAATIEGATTRDLWNAAYVFSAMMNGIAFDPNPNLEFPVNRGVVALIINESVCEWSEISVDLGNINGALGFLQSDLGFTLRQYAYDKAKGACAYQFSAPPENITDLGCPELGSDANIFAITLSRGSRNVISWSSDGISLQYTSCGLMRQESALLRDMLAPGFLSGVEKVQIPVM